MIVNVIPSPNVWLYTYIWMKYFIMPETAAQGVTGIIPKWLNLFTEHFSGKGIDPMASHIILRHCNNSIDIFLNMG